LAAKLGKKPEIACKLLFFLDFASMKWRFAIIGCGHIGLRHAALAAKYGELVAVCDNDPRKLDNQLFAGCSRFTDATEKQAANRYPGYEYSMNYHHLVYEAIVRQLAGKDEAILDLSTSIRTVELIEEVYQKMRSV